MSSRRAESRQRPPARRSGGTARRPSSTATRSGSTRSRGAAQRQARHRPVPAPLIRGQRPFVFAFVALLVVLATMAATPAQRYFEAQERVDALTELRDELAADVDALEDRKARLHDPDEIELLARRELGLVRPGETPYVIVRPDDDQPRLSPRDSEAEPEPRSWWRRLGEAIGLLGDADDRPEP